MAQKIKVYLVYSYWIYALSILYFFDIIPYSPLFSNLLMIAFLPALLIFNNKISFIKKLFCLVFEFSFLVLVLIKGVKMDFVFNYLLIMFYLIILALNNKTLCDIYCNELPNMFIRVSRKMKKKFCIMNLLNEYTLI